MFVELSLGQLRPLQSKSIIPQHIKSMRFKRYNVFLTDDAFYSSVEYLQTIFCSLYRTSKVNMWSSARGGGLLQGADVFYDKFSDFHEATLR